MTQHRNLAAVKWLRELAQRTRCALALACLAISLTGCSWFAPFSWLDTARPGPFDGNAGAQPVEAVPMELARGDVEPDAEILPGAIAGTFDRTQKELESLLVRR